jgi:hypothetical protein
MVFAVRRRPNVARHSAAFYLLATRTTFDVSGPPPGERRHDFLALPCPR